MKLKLLSLVIITSMINAIDHPQAPMHQEWSAYQFHKHSKKSLPIAKQLLQRFNFEKCESVLDVGCGPGALTAFIAKKGPQATVVGIDPSDSMIRFARDRYKKHKNLFFVQEDMSNTSLSGKFEFIFCCNVFHLLPKLEQAKALKAMGQILDQNKPGILLMVMAAKSSTPPAFEKAYAATIATEQWKKLQTINLDDYFQPHDEISFSPLAKDSGILVKKTEIVDEHIVFKNVNKLRKFIKSWMTGIGFVAALSKDEQKQLIKDILKEYTKEVQTEVNGSIEWRSPRLVVLAERAKN